MMDFYNFVESHGIKTGSIQPGQWYRYKKDKTYKIDNSLLIGWVKDWKNNAIYTWKPNGETTAPKIDKKHLQETIKEQKETAINATLEAREHYQKARMLKDSHPYIENKKLSLAGCFGLKVDYQGFLVVPMYYKNQIMSIQRIKADGTKLFWKDAGTQGTSYTLSTNNHSMTIFTEGFATGLTLFQAIPQAKVVVCFNCHNISKVIKIMNPKGFVCVAADNDHETELKRGFNPGIDAAKEIQSNFGIGYTFPECKGTDWNDYYIEKLEILLEQNKYKKYQKTDPMIKKIALEEIALKIKKNLSFL